MWWSSKNWFGTVPILGGCGGLERTDFQQFLIWEAVVVLKQLNFKFLLWERVVVLKELIFKFLYWEGVVVLKEPIFNRFYIGRVWCS